MSNNTDPQDSIVFNPEATNTKSFDKDSVEVVEDVVINENRDSSNDGDEIVFNQDSIVNINSDNDYNIDISKYAGDLGHDNEDVYMPDFNGIDVLNQARADDQAWYEQAGNFLGQAVVGEIVGGTIEGLGYMLDIGSVIDVIQGDETEWGNFITDFGQGIREDTQEALEIHQDPSAQGWGKMADSGWWFSNSVSVASTLSMLLPTMGAMKALSFVGKGIGASKGLKAVRRAAGLAEEMGTKAKWMTNGVSQAVLSRNIENWMEAHGTYESYKAEKLGQVDKKTGEKYTEEEANRLASKAASDNWKKGWAMLLQDIPQYLALGKIFDPISKKMVRSVGVASKRGIVSKMKPWQQKTIAAGKTFIGEGAEESYQYLIAEHAKFKTDLDSGYITEEQYDKKMSDAYGSEEMMTSAFFGGLGGNLFQAAGSVLNDAFKSKDRKEYDKKLGEMYTKSITNQAKQVSLMFQHLNTADEAGSKTLRETVINESMLNLAASALEAGKFDQFYETIGLVSEMSEEDLASFEETTGQEFSTELAKEYAPKIQKKAIEMRDKYLKLRNKHGALTSSKLARLEMENDSITGVVNEKNKAAADIKGNIGKDFDRQATDRLRIRLDIRERGQVLTKRKKELNNRLRAETSEVKKTFIQAAIDNNELLIKKQKADAYKQKLDTKNRTASEKEVDGNRIENDKAAEKIYNKLHKQDILDALDVAAQGREQIIINNEDMAFAKTDEGAKLQQAEKLRKQISSYDQIPDKTEAIESLKEAKDSIIPDVDYLTQTEKDETIEKIEAKITELETQIGEDKATKLAEETETRLKEKNKKENADPTIESNQIIKDVGDVIEDENFEANPDTTYAQIESATKVARATAGDGKLLALLDKVDGTEEYQKWNENPTSKVGKEFGYTVSERSEKIGEEQNDAIEAFEKLPKGGKVPQSIYDHLPIRATLKDHAAIMTYLPHKPSDDTSLEDKVAYEKGYAAQRVVIIDMLRKGETVTATVALNTGGELNVTHDNENRLVPENSVMDLLQIGNMISKVNLLITDKFGYLMGTNKKTDKELGNRPILLQNDKKGNKMPYRGGMFLKVKKANGDPFALRLNMLKNTEDQAKLLAGLLIKLGVPTAKRDKGGVVLKNDKGTQIVGKELVLSSKISELTGQFRDDVERIMGPELKMLDKEYKDPKIIDLINSFVYVSENTENKTTALYFSSDNHLIFGDKGVVNLINREEDKTHDDLVEFLMNKKRRQFNINLWNKSDEYKEYILDNKIVSTDASTSEALFTNQRKRWGGIMKGGRIQLYMNPVGAKAQAGVIKDSKGNETLSHQSEKEQLDAPHSTAFVAERFGGKKAESPVTTPAKAEVAPETSILENDKYKVERTLNKYGDIEDSIVVKKSGKGIIKLTSADGKVSYAGIGGVLNPNLQDLILKDKNFKDLMESKPTQQTSEIEVTPSQLVDIMNLKIPTQPGINRILGLDLTDDSAIKYLEEKGIVSKAKGAKGREFLISKEDALNTLQPTQQSSEFVKAPLEDIHPDDIAEMSDDNYKELVSTGYTMFYDQHGETIELSTKFGDTKIRKEETKAVSSGPKEANKEVVSQTFINFAKEEEFEEEDFSDVEGDDVITTEDLASLDDGEIETNCKNS